MTVKELVAELQKIENQNRVVILSSDSEGNEYIKLGKNCINHAAISEDYGHHVEVGIEKLTPELEKMGYAEEDVAENGIPAIIIYS
jgi:hypothetical protein